MPTITVTKIFSVCCLFTSLVLFAQALKCDPLDNVFYHKQLKECLPCNTCPVGMGKISLQEWDIAIDSMNGPSSCIPCRPCKSGSYSEVSAFKCKPCTNCTQKSMYTIKSCTSEEDAVCDEQAGIFPRTGSVKRNGSNNGDENSGKTSNSVSTVGIVFIVLFVVVAIGIFIGVGWKIYRKKSGTRAPNLHTTESGEYGSHDNYSPNQGENPSHLYRELQGQGRESSSEDDEQTPLIPPQRKIHQIKRKRLVTYPFCQYSNEEDDLETDFMDISNDTCDYRHSYPMINVRKDSHDKLGNNVLDSGFADFTLRGQPHHILMSFNIKDNSHVIKKVKEWDSKYNWSKDIKNTNSISPYNFFLKYANDHEKILQKVKKWEENEGLTCKFLGKVSRYLGPQYKFRSFAREAGLSDTDLTNIQQNFKDDVVEQGYQVLVKLKHKEVICKEKDVIDFLQHLGFTDIIAKISQ